MWFYKLLIQICQSIGSREGFRPPLSTLSVESGGSKPPRDPTFWQIYTSKLKYKKIKYFSLFLIINKFFFSSIDALISSGIISKWMKQEMNEFIKFNSSSQYRRCVLKSFDISTITEDTIPYINSISVKLSDIRLFLKICLALILFCLIIFVLEILSIIKKNNFYYMYKRMHNIFRFRKRFLTR
jgi:hypothetical protein